MRKVLTSEEWGLVESVMAGEFGNGMPATPEQGSFLAELDAGRLAGFVHVETVFHFSAIYVAPGFRGSGLAHDLARDANARIPSGFSGLWLTNRPSRAALARALGGRELGTYTAFRRDS